MEAWQNRRGRIGVRLFRERWDSTPQTCDSRYCFRERLRDQRWSEIAATHPATNDLTVLAAVKGSLAELGAPAPLTATARRNLIGR